MKSPSKLKRVLWIHIGKVHKEDVLESTPKKERDKVQDETSLLLTTVKKVREEPEAEDTFFLPNALED